MKQDLVLQSQIANRKSQMSSIIQTRGLSKKYGDFFALADCTLDVPRGETFGLLGPNGAGKTTLLRLLMGFLRPTAGTATIDGLDCHSQAVAVHTRVAYLPGEPRLSRRMDGHGVLRFFTQLRPQASLARANQLAERLELDLSRQVARSSTGMRQKLALCIVLSIDAPLLILDEPTSSLDPTMRVRVQELIREAKAAGRTVLFSSHVLSEVEEVCDRVAVLRKGRLVHLQAMSEVRRRHRIAARLTGPLPPVPSELHDVEVVSRDGHVSLETPGDLRPLLGWLAKLPLDEVRIEPLGLKAVYQQFHGDEADK